MDNMKQNPILRIIGEELKKADINYQQQQQARQQKLQQHPLQQTNAIITSKTTVRNKNKSEDIKLNHAEAIMKIQLFVLAVLLTVIWLALNNF